MKIKPLSPHVIRAFVAPIAFKPPSKKTAIRKKKKADFDNPKYDPEFDMIEARLNATKPEIPTSFSHDAPNPFKTDSIDRISTFGYKNTSSRQQHAMHDKFTYFTLIETILMANLLYKQLPKGPLELSFGTQKILKAKKQLVSKLVLYTPKKMLKTYLIVYDLPRSTYYMYDPLKKEKRGAVNFNVVGANAYMEEAHGTVDGHKIDLDPVWDPNAPNKIKYQTLQIGHRKLDLTSVSKNYRTGNWSFKGTEPPIPYHVYYESSTQKKDHIITKKKIEIGKSVVRLTLNYFDDIFTEPYAADGQVIVK